MASRAVLVAQCNDGRASLRELATLEEHDREITFETFARHVDLRKISEYLGYSFGHQKGLHLRKDYHVRYYVSRFRGQRCWHLDWSSIDHIFVKPKEGAYAGS